MARSYCVSALWRNGTLEEGVEKYKLAHFATYLLISSDLKTLLCFAVGIDFSKFTL